MRRSGDELLKSLKRRRSGADRLDYLDEAGKRTVFAKQLIREAYEGKATGTHTQYAIGAMQEVDADYTRISIETAGRVEAQLNRRLAAAGYSPEFRLQGSVPLNVHIRGVSDVDLLTIESQSLYFEVAGVKAQRGHYSQAPIPTLTLLANLRRECETSLKEAFYAARVDVSGAKAVKVVGGSLPRAVDVVPSLWWDTANYQSSGNEVDRGVSIYDKDRHEAIHNLPFLHINRITERCNLTLGGLRKAIRLCKNVKADLEEDGTDVALSSYEIAGLMYHADLGALRSGYVFELAILAETQRHLDALWTDKASATALVTPDGSRKILDEKRKIDGLLHLSSAMDRLLANVAKEQDAAIRSQESPLKADCRNAIRALVF